MEQKPSVSLRLSTLLSAPYYTKVWLRVSGYDLEPLEYTREGVFYPGDRVVFELNLPEGKERLLEAILYDHRGLPVYYSWGFYDLYKNTTATMELKPCVVRVDAKETFLDKALPTEEDFFLFSPEGLNINLSFRAPAELCLAGALLGRRGPKGWELSYVPNPSDLTVRVDKPYSFEILLPDGVPFLTLYGSKEGVFEGGRLELVSSTLTSQKEPVLAGYDQRGSLYMLDGNSFKKACGDCRSLEFVLPVGFGATLWGERFGLFVPLQEGERYAPLQGYRHYAMVEGFVSEPCRFYYRELILLENFSGSARLEPKERRLVLEGIAPNASIRIFSKDGLYLTEGVCESSSKAELRLYELVQRELWLEVAYPNGRFYRFLLKPGQESLRVFEPELELEDLRLDGRTLYLRVKKDKNLSACALELSWRGGSLFLERMPGSYLRLPAEFFGIRGLPSYRLTCMSADGSYSAGLLGGGLEEGVATGILFRTFAHK